MTTLAYSPAHKALVYTTTEPLSIAEACPEARRLPDGRVVVPATLPNLRRLAARGLPVIEPMQTDGYAWPGRFKPFAAQRTTANFLALHKRATVLSDMGTGKTNAALWAADYLMDQHPPGEFRALVVAPLSTLRRVWSDAVFQGFLGKRKAVVLHGSAEQRLKLLAQPADFYVINHDGLGVGAQTSRGRLELRGFADALQQRSDIRLVIVDEVSAYRDASTRRHKLARALIGQREYLWGMTGTPTPNGPLDAYGIAKLMNNAHGESMTSFRLRTMLQVSTFKWVPKAGSQDVVKTALSPTIRFAIEECVDLPECTVQQREVELSAEQAKAYKTMKQDLRLMVTRGEVNAANEAVLRLKLLQISCGAIYDADRTVHHLDCAPRLKELEDVIEEAHRKVIIFAPLTSVVDLLKTKLTKWSRAVINGSVPDKQRSEIFRAFQDDAEPQLLIADPGTMSHGLTLTKATTIVWYAPTDRTETYLQANKRIHRPGQDSKTTIVQIAATTIEREIFRRLEANESLQGVVLKLAEDRL